MLSFIRCSSFARWSLQELGVMRVIGEEIFLKLVKLGNRRQRKIRGIGLGEKCMRALVGHDVESAGDFCALCFCFPVATRQLATLNNAILLEGIKVNDPVGV